MSMPNIPNIDPKITLTAEQSYNLLLSSIAMEELAQAHILNAEAEKIQYVLGTLKGAAPIDPPTFRQLIALDDSVCMTLRNVIKNQMLLGFKLEDTIGLYSKE